MRAANGPIKVLLVDDHALFRQGVTEILAADDGVRVVGQAENGEEAVALARETKPDMVLLDIEMPGQEAEDTLQKVLHVSPSSRVIILTMYDEPGLVRGLLASGAQAYMVKSATREELLATLRAVDRDVDRVVLSVSRATLDRLEGRKRQDALSPRELEVLSLAAKAMSNAEISSRLYISEGTVKRHLTNVFAKLGVSSRAEAVNKGVAVGLVRLGTPRDTPGEGGPL